MEAETDVKVKRGRKPKPNFTLEDIQNMDPAELAKRMADNPPAKRMISLRADVDVIDYFKEKSRILAGGRYQTMINQVLRDYMEADQKAQAEKNAIIV